MSRHRNPSRLGVVTLIASLVGTLAASPAWAATTPVADVRVNTGPVRVLWVATPYRVEVFTGDTRTEVAPLPSAATGVKGLISGGAAGSPCVVFFSDIWDAYAGVGGQLNVYGS
jgi:hypothetical protein